MIPITYPRVKPLVNGKTLVAFARGRILYGGNVAVGDLIIH